MARRFRFITVERRGPVAVLRLERPDKRNAVNTGMIEEIGAFALGLPDKVRVMIITGSGPHFSAGLDLAEHRDRAASEGLKHSRLWHRVLDGLQYGGRPVIAALHGAVVGGGVEIAAAAHIRVADATAFYQLPEGRRGIFVGGGASVRVSRLIGVSRVTELMLTGRTLDAEEGQRIGLSHYLVEPGKALAKARELAATVSANAALSNYMILNALPRIAEMPAEGGFLAESMAAALTQTSLDARRGIEAFLKKRKASFD